MNKLMALSTNIITLAVTNPYLTKVNGILTDVKGWILAIIAGITVATIAMEGVKYQQGDGQDKSEAMKNIKKKLLMGGGIFFFLWFATYIITIMST